MKAKLFLFGASLFFVSISCYAFEKHAYVDTRYMALKLSNEDLNSNVNPTAIEILVGKATTRFTKIEGMFVFGLQEDSLIDDTGTSTTDFLGTFTGNIKYAVKIKTMVGMSFLVDIPITQFFEIYSRVGFAAISIEENLILSGTAAGGELGDFTGTDNDTLTSGEATGLYGLGGKVQFTDHSALTFEYLKIPELETTVTKYEIESINIGYQYSFK